MAYDDDVGINLTDNIRARILSIAAAVGLLLSHFFQRIYRKMKIIKIVQDKSTYIMKWKMNDETYTYVMEI